jgi:3-oxoadipate enol-lactonase
MQITSNGSSFHCRIDGGSGPWVMLAHGLATDLTMWDELTDVLKDNYRVLRYDARGHGGSTATESDYTLDMLVADAVGILDRLNIAQCHFGGLSMGGMVTLGMLLDHPARITSAIIADSRHTTTPDFTAAWHARAEEVRQGGVAAVVASTVRRWSSEGLAERNPAVIARMETMIRRTSDRGYCGCAAALARLNYGHRLARSIARRCSSVAARITVRRPRTRGRCMPPSRARAFWQSSRPATSRISSTRRFSTTRSCAS